MKKDGERLHHTIQNGKQPKTQELLISGIFHLRFLANLIDWIKEKRNEQCDDCYLCE